jgi:hypothetical protein
MPAFIVAIIVLFIWLAMLTQHGPQSVGPPPSIPGPPLFQASVQLLGLLYRGLLINEAEASVTVPSSDVVPQPTVFYPIQFVSDHHIQTAEDVEAFDTKSAQMIQYCTQRVLEDHIVNYVAQLDARVYCLQSLGYSGNDMSYVSAKFGRRT